MLLHAFPPAPAVHPKWDMLRLERQRMVGMCNLGEHQRETRRNIMTHFLHRRRFLHLAAGTSALPALSGLARAQAYPLRPVHLISAYAPGGINDLFARLIGQWLSERLGQQFVVENRSGAGGNIGTEAIVRSAPDGYTLLLIDNSNAFNATLYDNLKFNFIRDIAPIASIFRGGSVLVVHPSFPASSVP
jgi:tripartite-type tricarboxylate transporter receptor subunit TctC